MSEDEQATKRRRKSGWESNNDGSTESLSSTASLPVNASAIAEAAVPILPTTSPLPSVASPAVSAAAMAQQAVIQRAQMIAAQAGAALVANTSIGASISKIENRIYVGSLFYDLTDADVRALFSSFGTITKVDMSKDPITGRSKGYCFVEFSNPDEANAAQAMNGFVVAGRQIKVGRPVGVGVPNISSNPFMNQGITLTALKAMASNNGSVTLNPTIPVTVSASSSTDSTVNTLPSSTPSVIAEPSLSMMKDSLMHDSSIPSNTIIIKNIPKSFSLNDITTIFASFGKITYPFFREEKDSVDTRVAVLVYDVTANAMDAMAGMQGFVLGGNALSIEIKPVSQTSVILRDMITAEDVNDSELRDEIWEEACKFGKLFDIEIRLEAGKGVVILKYETQACARGALLAMNKRQFAGNVISAAMYP